MATATGCGSADRANPVTSRFAILASGRGSNLQALLDAIDAGSLNARIVGVFSDKPGAAALARVPEPLRWARDAKTYADRATFDAGLADAVAACQPDWVICAGYLRLLGDAFVARFRGRLLNIHPSLLPSHRGLRTHARALDAGDAEHGASVHFVVPELDAGAVIARASVPILANDNAERLAERVLQVEHPLLVHVARLAADGRLDECDGISLVDGHPLFTPLRLRFTPA